MGGWLSHRYSGREVAFLHVILGAITVWGEIVFNGKEARQVY